MQPRFVFLMAALLAIQTTARAAEPFGGRTIINFEDASGVMSDMASTGLKVGDAAPDMQLMRADDKGVTVFSDLWADKPLVMLFGSRTCDITCTLSPEVHDIYERFGTEANFVYVYIREAHAQNGWAIERKFSIIEDPETHEQRLVAASKLDTMTKYPFLTLIDGMDDGAAKAYGAWPNRIYVIAPGGKVAFAGAVGPWGFRPLKTSAVGDPDLWLPFVPKRNDRPSLEAFLERHFEVDVAAMDPFSGQKVSDAKMAVSMIMKRVENVPCLREPAPEVELLDAVSGEKAELSDFWKEKPAVITFASTTSEVSQQGKLHLAALEAAFGDRAQFVQVYLREACPADGFVDQVYSKIADPNTLEERARAARAFREDHGFTYPILVDSMSDEAAIRYAAWPARIVVVDTRGRMQYRGYQGPWCFKPTNSFQPPYQHFDHIKVAKINDVESVESFLNRFLRPAP